MVKNDKKIWKVGFIVVDGGIDCYIEEESYSIN